VKKVRLITSLLAAFLATETLLSQQNLSDPPGKLEVAKHPLILEPPAGPQPRKIDLSRLHQESLDLAQLAQSVPAEVDQAGQGKLPKDLSNKLKQIEKLSKHLRTEVVP
jgi:hypothetical protein